MNGKKGIAPCEHEGYHVVGNYVACPICDRISVPDPVEPEITEPIFAIRRCPRCSSIKTEEMGMNNGSWHCWKCGAVFFP